MKSEKEIRQEERELFKQWLELHEVVSYRRNPKRINFYCSQQELDELLSGEWQEEWQEAVKEVSV